MSCCNGSENSCVGLGLSDTTSVVPPVVASTTVENIAALKEIQVLGVEQYYGVEVLGYYTAGDGGGGVFFADRTSVEADNGGTVIAPDFGGGRWIRVQSEPLDVRKFGAKGDGVTNDYAAFASYWALCLSEFNSPGLGNGSTVVSGPTFNIPQGDYVFNGTALNYTSASRFFRVTGTGFSSCRIRVANSDYFIKWTSLLTGCELSGIQFTGGKGALKHTFTGVNVQTQYHIHDCQFTNYTECAIGSLSSDMPNWKIEKNIFYGSSSFTSIGVALYGLADSCVISENDFSLNRHHIKARKYGNLYIHDNGFIRFATPTTDTSDIWLVPTSTSLNEEGCVISQNKFGNENRTTTDYYILIALEGAGTDFCDKNFATTDMGASLYYAAGGFSLRDNLWSLRENQTRGFITSYTPHLRGIKIDGLTNGGVYGSWIKLLCTYSKDRLNQTTELFLGGGVREGPNFLQYGLSSEPLGLVHDPFGFTQGQDSAVQFWTVGGDSSYRVLAEPANLYSSIVSGGTTNTAIDDVYGNAGGVNLSWNSAFGYCQVYFTPTVAKKPVWIEMDMRAPATNPFPWVEVDIMSNPGSSFFFRRLVALSSEWRRYRFLWIPNDTANARVILADSRQPYSAGVATQVDIARLVVYQSNEPVSHQRVVTPTLALQDGITAPSTITGKAAIYVDAADGDLKIKFADGTVKTIVVDT